MAVRTPDIIGGGGELVKGTADGFVVKYTTTTSVIITSGIYEADGIKYILTADTTHALTSLAAGADFHYIYIDDSASSGSSAVFIDSITEPVFDDTRRGWYNGDDRLVGVIFSPDASATIEFFDALSMSGNLIRNTIERKLLAANQNPNGTYQTPNIAESSVFVPVNAVEGLIYLQNTGSTMELTWRNNEAAALTPFFTAPSFMQASGRGSTSMWDTLGVSRNVKIQGRDPDVNTLFAAVKGYGYSR